MTNRTARRVSVIDTAGGKVVAAISTGREPGGIAMAPDGKLLYVANRADHTVSVIDTATRKAVATIRCGFEPTALAMSPDGKRLFTANYCSDDVSEIDTASRKLVRTITVGRAPTHLAITPDGKTLVVNNSLSHQPATDPKLSAHVSVVDLASGKEIARKTLPGPMLVGQGILITPDGKTAMCVHARPNFNITPVQVNQGWTQTHALSIIPLAGKEPVVTVLLDNVNSGAANPYDLVMSRDGKQLFISLSGTHEITILRMGRLKTLLARTKPEQKKTLHLSLGFLWRDGKTIRRVGSGGLGPRGLGIHPKTGNLYVANYYSNSVAVLDATTGKLIRTIALGGPSTPAAMSQVRRGEFYFHDARQCFQQWASCISCHPRVRVDGANWDLLNDGVTNPKNAKSLVGSWQTPPSMALGVRASMDVAAEKGFRFALFVQPPKDVLDSTRAFLRAVKHIPSPFHRDASGKLDASATRGKAVFAKANCDGCHPAPLYTDLELYDVGTRAKRDFAKDVEYDTPTLVELYRTAPYLHDGRAATLAELFTKYNPKDEHGDTTKLTKQELDDLVAFLRSL